MMKPRLSRQVLSVLRQLLPYAGVGGLSPAYLWFPSTWRSASPAGSPADSGADPAAHPITPSLPPPAHPERMVSGEPIGDEASHLWAQLANLGRQEP
jgi:hypothetical protein